MVFGTAVFITSSRESNAQIRDEEISPAERGEVVYARGLRQQRV